MFEPLQITRMAQELAAHSGASLSVVARNIANADTPGYRAESLPDFATLYADQGGAAQMRATRPGHIGAGGDPLATTEARPREGVKGDAPNGNNVALENEVMEAARLRQQHDMALSIYRNAGEILRLAMGRV